MDYTKIYKNMCVCVVGKWTWKTNKHKILHSIFFRRTGFEDTRIDRTGWNVWDSKRDIEGPRMAAQEQVIRAGAIKNHIDRVNTSPLCRLCGEWEEMIALLVSEYKKPYPRAVKLMETDRAALVLRWQLCKKYTLEHAKKAVWTQSCCSCWEITRRKFSGTRRSRLAEL